MIDFKTEQSADITTLIISGELTIQNASALQGIFIRTLETSSNLTIHLEHVSEVDLSFLQLLCSVHKTSRELNKCITMSGSCPEVFRDVVRTAGFLQYSGCRFDCSSSCLGTQMDRDSEKRRS